ncbi:hypothetical protein FRC20_001126 [Serendipita sp. 405]|nr:hypothetical protein FRC20_001126 [Serendipita sp. 405]
MLVCSEGHILQGYRKETAEIAENSQHVMRKRTVKSLNKAPKSRRGANPIYYRKERAEYLYFQCQQLLLRLQIVALQRIWSLPPEFEAICRDVWSIYLTVLPKQPEATPLTGQEDGLNPLKNASSDEENASERSESVSQSSDDDEMPREQGPVDDLARLLDNLSDTSEDEDEPIEKERSTQPEVAVARDRRNNSPYYGGPPANIAVIVVVCWILRIPVLYRDLIKLIKEHELPYLNPIERGLFPKTMTRHMAQSLVRLLSPAEPPRTLRLHRLASHLAGKMYHQFSIAVPEANTHFVITRSLEALHLPPIFYAMTTKLLSMLDVSFTLHPSLVNSSLAFEGDELKIRMGENAPVEMIVTCALVLLLKLTYALDLPGSITRSQSENMLEFPLKQDILSKLTHNDANTTSIRTALDLSDKEIDEYLVFCTRALLSTTTESNNPVHSFFPLRATTGVDPAIRPSVSEGNDPLQRFDTPIALEPPVDNERQICGQKYRIYYTNDALGSLPAELSTVVAAAARWCKVDDEDILRLLEVYERRLVRMASMKQRK